MTTFLRSFLIMLVWLGALSYASAFNFNLNDHLRVYYDYCEEDIVFEFLYFQAAGDNDRMNYLYFKHNPPSGSPNIVLEVRHDSQFGNETGWTTLGGSGVHANNFGYKVDYQGDHNFMIIRDGFYQEFDQEGEKYFVRFRLRVLPDSQFETFSISGFWNGQGSNSENMDISMVYPMSLSKPAAPTGFSASQGKCGNVILKWNYDEFDFCPGWNHVFRLYRDNSETHFAEVAADTLESAYMYSDPQPATGTDIVDHTYRIRFLMRKNGVTYQQSPFAGPTTGHSLPQPLPPTPPAISFPDCEGAVKLNWDNPQLYDSIEVRLRPATGPDIVKRIAGSSTTYIGMITDDQYWNAIVIGIDQCGQPSGHSVTDSVHVPDIPVPFTLDSVKELNGNIKLYWTTSTGATKYTVIRQSPNGQDEFVIEDPTAIMYLDSNARVCTDYTYSVRATNQCGSRTTTSLDAPPIPEDLDIWTTQKLTASKGYFGNKTELTWDAPSGYAFNHFLINRIPLQGTPTPQFVATVNKNDLSYIDNTGLAGTLYTYQLIAVSNCQGESYATPLTDVGFRLPIAIINGNVKFQNGTGVDSVQITVERNAGSLGKGLQFDGQGALTIHPHYYPANPENVLGISPTMAIELWIKPEQLSSDFTVFRYGKNMQGYQLSYDASTSEFVLTFDNNTTSFSTSYSAQGLGTSRFHHIAWTRDGSQHKLYLDDQEIAPGNQTATSLSGDQGLVFGEGLQGYMDEIRFWNTTRTAEMIFGDYKQILSGDEPGLIGYWPANEGAGTGVYDVSGEEPNFNAHHMQMNGHVAWSNQFPESHLLGNRAITDSVGNYSIQNIRFSGTGNTFTVVPFYSPGGTPHDFDPASTVLFLGEGNAVENGVNFVDKSSFLVTGSILYSYPDSMCANSRAFIYIDDQVATVNGLPAVANADGIFAIDVPIGFHRISVKQAGHVFQHMGVWPANGMPYNFQKDESGIEFYDSTVVKVIGRVVGGTREGEKRLGFDDSVNNIGVAEITFSAVNLCHSVTVATDSVSGEYSADLLPLLYNVSVTVPSNPGLSFGTLDALDLGVIQPTQYIIDTLRNFAGQPIGYDTVSYNIKKNYIYRAAPQVDLTDAATGGPVRGDSVFTYIIHETRDTVNIPLGSIPYPVFIAGKKYYTEISAFEPYFNFDHMPDVAEDRVPVTDATVTISNGLGNAGGTGQSYEEKFEINNPEGKTAYTFFGGQPEFTAEGNPAEDYTQILDMQLETPAHTVSWREGMDPFRGYVLGAKPDVGSSFITEGPELVDYILRDPPGDASSAKFIEGSSYTQTESWYLNTSVYLGTGIKLKAGSEWFIGGGIAGVGFDSKVQNDQKLGIKLTTSMNINGDYSETTSFEQEITTNSDPWFPGDMSDLFVGKSQNFLFGSADELTLVNTEICGVIDACIGPVIPVNGNTYRLGRRENLFIVPQGFNTTFAYSQLYIVDYLIPNIEELRNALFSAPNSPYHSYLNQDDPGFGRNNDDAFFGTAVTSLTPLKTETVDYDGASYRYDPPPTGAPDDRVRWYNQQIRLWEAALAQNEKEKLGALLQRNISFDALSTLSYTSTVTHQEAYSVNFEVGINSENAFGLGAIFAGSGAEFTLLFGFDVAAGTNISGSEEVTSTYGYTLADSQPGDFFSVDVKDGLSGNGPVFSLRGGQSMCPWEPGYVTQYYNPGTELSQSTIRRELPDIDVEPSFQNNIPEHQPARYTLKLRNASPTGDIQWYGLRVLDDGNMNNAILKIEGFSPNRVFEVPAGETVIQTLELYKTVADDYEVKLMLYSTCEYDGFQNGAPIYASDTITIHAHFIPACSPVSVNVPVDLWVHNTDQGDTIPIVLQDYLIGDPNLENLKLQYKPSFTSVWNGIQTIWKTPPPGSQDPMIPAGSQFLTYLWNIEELPDGPYDIRVVSHCTNTDNDYASPKVTGIIDRLRPHAFGNPQPADGVLDPNDEILIQFNEPINPATVSSVDFDLRAVLNGAELRHEASIQFDGINDYIEVPQGTRLPGQPFTFEIWLKRLRTGAEIVWSQGIAQDSSMAIGFNASNRLYFRWHNNTIASTATILNDGNWHHIAVTCNDNRQVNFFHNGEFAEAGTVGGLYSIPGQMVFGKAAWNGTLPFKGFMHEARIWHIELTEGSIRTQLLKQLSGASPGLSLLYPMDEGSGEIVHEKVRRKHASLFGDWAILPSGSSFSLNGSHYLQVNAGTMVFDDQVSFTIACWLKGAPAAQTQTIFSNGKGDGTDGNDSGWNISIDAGGKLLVVHGGQTFTVSNINLRDNDWHHVALVLNRQGNLNTYIDGNLQTSLFGDVFGDFGGPYLWIGARGWYNGTVQVHDQYFNGLIDEVRVWNTKMTAEYIRSTMNNRLAGDEFGLQFYLPFESYMLSGGIPVLNEALADGSPYHRVVVLNSGSPVYSAEDPNIKLTAPFEKVNFTYSINGDKILITPTTDPLRLEKTLLFIALDNIEDIHGNALASPISWTAFVNKNQLQWEEDELYIEKPEKESYSFTTRIVNSGGIELSYEILGLPEWLTVSPAIGTIAPVSSRELHFTIHPDLLIGDYSIDLNLLSGQGYNDKLSLDVKVFGIPPTWSLQPSAYQHNMSIVADLKLDGDLSEDELDLVAAYINGEVRGLASPIYLPELDQYLLFMEVYSKVTSGETVSFKAWDASTGATYAGVNIKVGNQTQLTIPFNANTLVGNAVTPAHFEVTGDVIQEIPIHAGWTWISFNVLSSKFANLDQFFAELDFENNDAIYSQTKNAIYNPSSGFQGNLKNEGLNVQKMYKCDFTYEDVLRVSGPRVNPDNYPVQIVQGWNWIPYLSSDRINVNEALSSFSATPGDILKSQQSLAVYHPTQGWVGTLTAMEPGKGYMLFAANPGTIIYPLSALTETTHSFIEEQQTFALKWRSGSSPATIENQARNMTMIARLEGVVASEGMPVIAAFAHGMLVDKQTAVTINEEQGLYYFTLQLNQPDDIIYFEIYTGRGDYLGLAVEQIGWSADQHLGSYAEPFILHLDDSPTDFCSVDPSPFRDDLLIRYETAIAGNVRLNLYDGQGALVSTEHVEAFRPGLQVWTMNSLSGLPAGIYTLEIIQDQKLVRKILAKI